MSWASIAAGKKPEPPVVAEVQATPVSSDGASPGQAFVPEVPAEAPAIATESPSSIPQGPPPAPSSSTPAAAGAWGRSGTTPAWGSVRPTSVFGAAGNATQVTASFEKMNVSMGGSQRPLPAVAGLTVRQALEALWELDENRLDGGKDFELDLQGYTSYRGESDYARRPLFKNVDETVLKTKPTFAAFLNLLDNYEREVGDMEHTSSQEHREISQFLSAVMATPVMQYCHKFLAHQGTAPKTEREFKEVLRYLWFQGYASTKGGAVDSSGFEHVFVGEEKGSGVTGMHGWIQLEREEKKGMLNYCGYISHNRTRPDEEGHVLTLQFEWKDQEDGSVNRKPMSTSFIGVSPEFEIALYTMAALARQDQTVSSQGSKREVFCEFEDLRIDLQVVVWSRGSRKMLRTAYPEEKR